MNPRHWEHVRRLLYLNGGIESRHDNEGFGPAYDLPLGCSKNSCPPQRPCALAIHAPFHKCCHIMSQVLSV